MSDDDASDDDRHEPAPRGPDSPTALSSADPIRNFSLGVDERIRALTVGVPAWAARKRRIEDDEERYVKELIELHDALAARELRADEIARAVVAAAEAFDLSRLNELVRTHNRYYPVEANLPMDRVTGSYLVYGRPFRPEEPYTAARLAAAARAAIRRRLGDASPGEDE
ncbi:MAG: hypothetical protein KF764_07205 [Labilithrix sp.]|nr:hypothetical protein [Labilithrix sp.]